MVTDNYLDNDIVNVLASRHVRYLRHGSAPPVTSNRAERDPTRPVYVISVAASIVSVHPRTLRIYEDEGLVCPARTPSNNRLYSEDDIRRVLWIRHLTRDRGVNLAGIRLLFELEERLGTRILEALFDEGMADQAETANRERTVSGEPTANGARTDRAVPRPPI
jgi:MerR family transcriptional regulator, heat shock protein HspR